MSMDEWGEDHFAPCATPSEAVAEFAVNAGSMYPDRAWLLHDFDVWVRNPHYAGPPVPHPEDNYHEEDIDPRYKPGEVFPLAPRTRDVGEDDIPF